MKRGILAASIAAIVALGIAGCATPPRATNSTAEATLRSNPERLIVVTVANPTSAVATRAGSTMRGYDGAGSYSASVAAHSTVSELVREYSLQEVAAWPIDALHVHCIVFRIPDNVERSVILERLSQDRRVQIAQPLQVFATSTVTYNDPYVGLQSGFNALDSASAHQYTRGEGVRVAVIDTGIDTKHPDLAGRIVSEINFVDGNNTQFVQDRHGTGIAGIIAATGNNAQGIVGVAPGVKIVAIKACWQLQPTADDARCDTFRLAQAMVAAMDSNVQIVNLSISGPADPLLNELMKKGIERGMIFVGAAPRDGRPNSFPVSTNGVIAVDAVEHRTGLRDALPAPGDEILTLTPAGHYDFSSGTSLATAHVTGAVALLLNQNRKLTSQALQALLQNSRESSGSASINACAALAAMKPAAPCAAASRAAAAR